MDRKSVFLIIVIILINFSLCFSNNLHVYFLNVGEGDAIFLKTPHNKKILIDSGNLITGYNIINFFRKQNIKRLDYLIITHPHPDHCGGVFFILQEIKVLKKYDNGQPINVNDCNDLYRWYKIIFRKRGNYNILKAGDKLIIDGLEFLVLSPKKFKYNWNENSLVIMCKYKKTKILLMGDANINVEKKLLNSNIDLSANILKVGHHGANDALSKEFLKAVNPQYAIISVNKNNIRGYPSKRVINLLKKYKIKYFITYRDGTIHFLIDGEKIRLFKK